MHRTTLLGGEKIGILSAKKLVKYFMGIVEHFGSCLLALERHIAQRWQRLPLAAREIFANVIAKKQPGSCIFFTKSEVCFDNAVNRSTI